MFPTATLRSKDHWSLRGHFHSGQFEHTSQRIPQFRRCVMFSKLKAGKLADHRPYDLKITLDEGTIPPFYSLSQEELAALCKFIN